MGLTTPYTEKSFRDGPDGKRLFFPFGGRKNPYVIPDAETEAVLFAKQRMMMRLMLAGALVAIVVANQFTRSGWTSLLWVLPLILVIFMGAFYLVHHLVFRRVLSGLERLDRTFAVKNSPTANVRRIGKAFFIILLIPTALMLALGLWFVATGPESWEAWAFVVLMGACTAFALWGLIVNFRRQDGDEA
ncbi:MAG: hypothetical protein KDE22_17995 [Rhodobacterales bacterium]|nr:hypothetical protein [Rhodobacterales bacterium]